MSIISMYNLKQQALKLSEPLKTIILSQPDAMDLSEFILKAGEWVRIIDLDVQVPGQFAKEVIKNERR